jgi:hypothetical protein
MDEIAALHRRLAVDQARELGLLDPEGSGSFTHPDLSRLLYADGKVLTPLYRAKPGEMAVDRTTGEVRRLRAEQDASLHVEGDGELAWGTKFVMVAVRTNDERGRIILDLEWVPRSGAEAETAMRCFRRITPLVPGAPGVIYDTALRGVHHQILLRELGLVPTTIPLVGEGHASVRGGPHNRDLVGTRVIGVLPRVWESLAGRRPRRDVRLD